MLTPEPPRSIFDGIDRRGDAIGALIAPFPQWVTNGMHYATDALDVRRVLAMHDWIVEEAQRSVLD